MRPLLTSAILLLATTLLHAQAPTQPPKPKPIPTARLTGHILCADTRGPARGAIVTLQIMNGPPIGDRIVATRTAIDGSYAINHLTPGRYLLIAVLPGYLSKRSDPEPDETSEADDDSEAGIERGYRHLYGPQNFIEIATGEAATADLVLERAAAISGHVLYADGAPASQVSIVLEETKRRKVMTAASSMVIFTGQTFTSDDEGHYRINGISPGTYRVVAVQPLALSADATTSHLNDVNALNTDARQVRFYAGDTYHQKSAKTYELRAGDNLRDIDIHLPIDGFHTIRVRLTATNGGPINSASLTLTDSADNTLEFRALKFGAGNPDGFFEFTQVPPGAYTLTSREARIMVQTPPSGSENEQFEPIRFHPTNAFANGAMTIILKDSDLLDLTLTLPEIPLPTKPTPP